MRYSRTIFLALLCLPLLFVLTCEESNPAARAGGDEITRADLQKILNENKGRPVLLNFWATWCRSCMPELRSLAKIQKKYEDRDLRVICVSVDSPEDKMRGALVRFTYDQAVEAGDFYGAYISRESHPREIMTLVDDEWLEIVPVTYLIDREGKVAERLVGSRALRKVEKKLPAVL